MNIWAASSEFVSSSIPSWHTLTAHAQPFRGARDLAFCLKVPLDSLLVWASSGGSGETARMRRLAWTFAARIGDKYQIRLTRSIWYNPVQLFYFRDCFINIYLDLFKTFFFLRGQYNEAGSYFGVFAIYFEIRDICPKIILGISEIIIQGYGIFGVIYYGILRTPLNKSH